MPIAEAVNRQPTTVGAHAEHACTASKFAQASTASHLLGRDAAATRNLFLGACLIWRQPDQENSMAVQQNKKSPSKRGMHRSHNALVTPGTAIEPTTGEVHLRHHISPTGFYRGRKVLKSKADA
jgi:large subunit ribosomal protein L32